MSVLVHEGVLLVHEGVLLVHEGVLRAVVAAILIARTALDTVSEITDYELRRELRLHAKARGLENLDRFKALNRYLPLTTEAMLKASDFWAEARRSGIPTADRLALDADVILAAQAFTLIPADWNRTGAQVVIATTNVGHLLRFVEARLWQNIPF